MPEDKAWMPVTTLLHLPCLQIDSSLTSRYSVSKIETEPQRHHQLPIPQGPQRIANAGRQGFRWGEVCCTWTNHVVGGKRPR